MVTLSPGASPSMPTFGARSFVKSSDELEPLSDSVRKSGTPGGLFGTVVVVEFAGVVVDVAAAPAEG